MKKFLALSIAFAMMLSLAACGGQQAPQGSQGSQGSHGSQGSQSSDQSSAPAHEFQEATYSLAHHMTLDHYVNDYCEDFANQVHEMTGGKVTIEVFGGSQLGGLKDNTDALRYNTLEFAIVDLPTLATIVPQLSLISLPFLFNDLDHVERFYDSEYCQALNQMALEQANVRILGNSHIGYRAIVGNVAVRTPEDLNNLKISCPDKPINVATMTAFGANPTVVPYGDNYTALQTGIIDCADQTPDSFYAAGLHQVSKYVSCTDHHYVDVCLGMSEEFFQQLEPELQDVILKAARIATENHRKSVHNAYEDAMEKVLAESSIERVTPDRELFMPIGEEITNQYLKDNPDMQETIDYIHSIG